MIGNVRAYNCQTIEQETIWQIDPDCEHDSYIYTVELLDYTVYTREAQDLYDLLQDLESLIDIDQPLLLSVAIESEPSEIIGAINGLWLTYVDWYGLQDSL